MFKLKFLVCIPLIIFMQTPYGSSELNLQKENISIVSLNLHGYHPMGEENRYLEDHSGKLSLAPSHIHYFSPEEIIRGHGRRVKALAKDIKELLPSIVLLQEVGGGSPYVQTKGCEDFYRRFDDSSPWENSAIQIEKQLKQLGRSYTAHLACRGNIGWFTSAYDFKDKRVVAGIDSPKGKRVVVDFNESPYPNGILVEGTAILVSDNIEVLEHKIWEEEHNAIGEKIFFQTMSFSPKNSSKWYLIANVHSGHKVAHFEQAVAIRQALHNYIQQAKFVNKFGGLIISGDFNARIYRPNTPETFSEISTIPYEISVEGQYDFNLTREFKDSKQRAAMLKRSLLSLNNSRYKPWATITDQVLLEERVDRAISRFRDFQMDILSSSLIDHLELADSVNVANSTKLCKPRSDFAGGCFDSDRIDFMFTSKNLRPINSYILFQENSWTSLESVTDHPGIFTTFTL